MSTSRRSFLAGLALPAIAAPTIAAATIPPRPTVDRPHPDQALFDAEAELREVTARWDAARARSGTASSAYRVELGASPPGLLLTEEDRSVTGPPRCWKGPYRRIHLRWATEAEGGDETGMAQIWTAPALRIAIDGAVESLGQGGRTPHLIRRWKALLPTAEAFDARCDYLDARHRVGELRAAVKETDKVRIAAEGRFAGLTARTPEGLAAKVRHLDCCGWKGMGRPWIALFLSAAAVAGVELEAPRFDAERWAREVHEAGGRVHWNEATGETRVSLPVDHRHTTEQNARLTRLSLEQQANGDEIRFWLSQGGLS